MFSKLIVVVSLLVSTVARADYPSEWTKTDTVLELGYFGAAGVDWVITASAAKENADSQGAMYQRGFTLFPYKYEEANPILGKHPSLSQVNSYFIITTLAHPLISYILPQPYRTIWQSITIGVEVTAVGTWKGQGVKLSVPW